MKRPALLLMPLSLSAFAITAFAQPPVDDDPRVVQARTVFEEGTAHYDAGRFALAAQSFDQSHHLLAEARHPRAILVLFNLGRSYEEIAGREEEAIAAYRRVVEEAPPGPEYRDTIGRATVRLREMEARRPRSAHGDNRRPIRQDEERVASRIHPAGPVVLSVGGAVLIAGVIAGIVSLDQHAQLADMCPGDVCPDTPELRDQRDEMLTLSNIADPLWIVGAVVAATGLVLTLLLHEERETEVSARCAPSGCMAGIRGTF